MSGRDRKREDDDGRDREFNDRTGEGSTSLLVRNVSYRVRSEEIKQAMEKHGDGKCKVCVSLCHEFNAPYFSSRCLHPN